MTQVQFPSGTIFFCEMEVGTNRMISKVVFEVQNLNIRFLSKCLVKIQSRKEVVAASLCILKALSWESETQRGFPTE